MSTGSKVYCYAYPHPAVTTDIVVFTIRDQQLQLLLIQRGGEPFRGSWALPGGFLEIKEDLEICAQRELREETGISGVHLEQLHTFGRPDRDPRERVISVVYFGLVAAEALNLKPGSDARSVHWFPLASLPDLAFDHAEIIALAHQRLLIRLYDSTLAAQLVPPSFSLKQLQTVYEILLNRSLDASSFKQQMLQRGLIETTGDGITEQTSTAEVTYRMKRTHTAGYNST